MDTSLKNKDVYGEIDEKKKGRKRVYRSPKLITYGSLDQLTKGGKGAYGDGANTSKKTP